MTVTAITEKDDYISLLRKMRIERLEREISETTLTLRLLNRELKMVQGETVKLRGVKLQALELPTRVYNALAQKGMRTVADVLLLLSRGVDAMYATRNFGDESMRILLNALHDRGFLSDEEYQQLNREAFGNHANS